jgi:signal transduction histidine kinase
MSTVLGIMLLFVYQYFANNLYNKFDRQLATLADAASHSLPKLSNISNTNSIQDLTQRDRIFDNDGDLDIPWQDLRSNQQMIEWFDITGKLLTRSGNHKIPSLAFNPTDQNLITAKVQQLDEHNDLRSLIIPIYLEGSIADTIFYTAKFYAAKNSDTDYRKVLIGYVRVSEPSEEIEEELERLISGLIWGGLLAIALSGVSGWWLASQALTPIERNYKQMRQFTADASHELRSPLTAIKTSIAVIQSHPERVHAADVKKVTAIAHATDQMANLVEDLLFLARVDNAMLDRAARNDRSLLPIPLDELLEDLLDSLEPQILAKALILEVRLTPAIAILGEVNQLRRLFTNLLENAIAYTPIGGKISIDLKHIDSRLIQVAIADTGLGIAPEDLSHIFERFWRADRARNWRSGGSGLGLAIAQAIAQSHGGNISVSSQVDIGSCFIVEFAIA